jgi:hypothetical protein
VATWLRWFPPLLVDCAPGLRWHGVLCSCGCGRFVRKTEPWSLFFC